LFCSSRERTYWNLYLYIKIEGIRVKMESIDQSECREKLVSWLHKKNNRLYETRYSSLPWLKKHIFGSLLNQLKQALYHYIVLLRDPLLILFFHLLLGLLRGWFIPLMISDYSFLLITFSVLHV
jgi:hypothetical protein